MVSSVMRWVGLGALSVAAAACGGGSSGPQGDAKNPAPAPSPSADASPTPAPDDVGARSATMYEACMDHYNAREWDPLIVCYAADVVQDEPGTGKPWVGPADAVNHLKSLVASFPDNTIRPELTLVNGGHAVSITVLRGTNDGPFPGTPGPRAITG